jgi:hypothetical protein
VAFYQPSRRHSTPNAKQNVSMSSPLILVAASSVLVTFALKKFGSSPWWIIPIHLALFLAWNGYRILIYQRYLNPLSRIPGPKVSASFYSDNFRVTGFGESFEHSSRKSLGKHISDGSGNIVIRQALSHFPDYSIPVKSCRHPASLFSILQVTRRFMLNPGLCGERWNGFLGRGY